MRLTLACLTLAVLAMLTAPGNAGEGHVGARQAAAPYLGQVPPGEVPVVFAPGIVSLPAYREYSGTFSSDGKEYYFYRFSDSTLPTIYQCIVVDSEWTAPEPVDFSVGYPASEPHLTYDNALLYFNWRTGTSPPGIYVTSRDSAGWAAPQYAGQGMFVSSDSVGNVYVTDMSSYFVNGKTYLAKVILNNGLFASYQRLNIGANYGSQAHPSIAPDGSYIIFDVDGGRYMYVSFRNPDSTWGEAIDLTAHGFNPLAGGATLSPDGKYLFFHLNGDIWWVDAQVIVKLRPVQSCCTGTTGDVNLVGIVDLSDLNMLIAYLTAPVKPTLPCPDEANVNAQGIIDLSDLSALISYLTGGGYSLPDCPTLPVLTTTSVSGILQTTAQCGGTIVSDGGAPVTARGVCWSANPTPTVTDSKTSDGTGTGGFISSITGLTGNTSYFVRAYATNSIGTGYGGALPFTTASSSDPVTDIDGNVYQTMTIGAQVWMKENLKVTHYRNGEAIPHVINGTGWAGLTTGAYCEYNNDTNNVVTYGRIYNWYAVADSRNIAPAGWHVPSYAEWQTLSDFLGGDAVAGGKLKEAGTAHWSAPNTGATNESGFSALPGGYRGDDAAGTYAGLGILASFWTSSEYCYNSLGYGYRALERHVDSNLSGFSVRCVRD